MALRKLLTWWSFPCSGSRSVATVLYATDMMDPSLFCSWSLVPAFQADIMSTSLFWGWSLMTEAYISYWHDGSFVLQLIFGDSLVGYWHDRYCFVLGLILHTCLPQIAFSGTKITKIWISETHQQTYPHIYEVNPAARFYGKISKGQSTLPIPCSWEPSFCRSHSLSASPITAQQHWELQSSRMCHLSRQSWQKATSHGLLS